MPSVVGDQIPIRAVASLTGVNAVTLRAWERRYGLIRPLRTPSGHRMYTHQHIDQIHRVLADRKSTRLNSSHMSESRMPSSA